MTKEIIRKDTEELTKLFKEMGMVNVKEINKLIEIYQKVVNDRKNESNGK